MPTLSDDQRQRRCRLAQEMGAQLRGGDGAGLDELQGDDVARARSEVDERQLAEDSPGPRSRTSPRSVRALPILRRAAVGLVAVAAAITAPVASADASIGDDARAPWMSPTWVAFEHNDVSYATVAVALADDGAGLVVYSEESPSRVIWAASVTPDGTIGDPTPVSWAGVASFDPQVAIASGGRAVIAWSAGPATSRRIEAVTRSGATAAFSKPMTVSAPGGRQLLSDVVLEPGGTSVIAWTRAHDGNSEAQIARLGRRLKVSSLGAQTHSPTLAVSAQHPRASLAWARTRGRTSEIWLRPDGRDRVRVAHTRRATSAPSVAAGNTIVATWLEGSAGVNAVLRAARLAPDGHVQLDEVADGPVASPSLSAGGSDIAVGWLQGGPDSTSAVYVARSTDASPGFAAATALSPPDGHASTPSVAVGAGRVAAVWNDLVQAGGAGYMCGTVAELGSAFPAERMLGDATDHVEATDSVRLALNAQGTGLGAYLTYGGDVGANGHIAIVRLRDVGSS